MVLDGVNLVVLRKKLRYNINVVRCLFVDDYILYKKVCWHIYW